MSEKLETLLAELAKVFGKTTRWQLLCQQQNATTEAEQIGLAEQVLAEPSTGTMTEGHSRWLELQGVQPQLAPYPYKPTGFQKKNQP